MNSEERRRTVGVALPVVSLVVASGATLVLLAAVRIENARLLSDCAAMDRSDGLMVVWLAMGLLAVGVAIGSVRYNRASVRPGLRLLVLHDDPEREFDYTQGAEEALARARDHGWTVVSVRDDWTQVFSDEG